MKQEENFFNKTNIWVRLLMAAVIIFLPMAIKYGPYISSIFGQHNVEDVRAKIENYLYEKYGEEFVVDRIGTRIDDGVTEYVARIYPKSIIGTNKEEDSYYYGSASIDKLAFGRLGKVGDNYGLIKINLSAEEYLMPKIKSIFGERVLLKTEVRYKRRQSDGFYVWYKEPSFTKAFADMKENPEKTRIELELYIYIFDRIDNEEEKEERRKQIFDFVQYLKGEGLFRYLSLIIKIVDERALTPSYRKYKRKLDLCDKETVRINGIKVELPPRELVNEMSEALKKELKEKTEEELINNMNKIRKSELGIDGIEGYLEQYFIRIISIDMMKIQPYGEYEEEKEKGTLDQHKYLKKEDIRFGKENIKYLYRNEKV